MQIKRYSVLPGFTLASGFAITYLSLLVLIPFAALFLRVYQMSWPDFLQAVTAPRVLASYKLSLGASLAGALINMFFGLIVAWVLVRYSFPGKRFFDSLIDLPFALPTAVAGVTLTTLYSANGWIGRFVEPFGLKIAFTPLGITLALTFIGLPFVVRAIQPVLEDLEGEVEEAAACLGASRRYTFVHVILPTVTPAMLTGFALAFARALGEYGSVVFISGNMPMKTEITPLLIMTKLEQYDYQGAAAIALVMLLLSFVVLLSINMLQWWSGRRYVPR
ncbi:MAG TPA: sulfate ABC transporter permease subunit CysT [Candidatus Hydrogenedentes bacterium]|nr:sulfate ABC transporter permease subunit CysT [Candidatus Hydrogenedentota bacterium]